MTSACPGNTHDLTPKGNKVLHGYRRRGDTLTATIGACAALVTLPA